MDSKSNEFLSGGLKRQLLDHIVAGKTGKAKVVIDKLCARNDFDINTSCIDERDDCGFTALYFAIIHGDKFRNTELIKYLIDKGANVNKYTHTINARHAVTGVDKKIKKMPLQLARRLENSDIIKLLIEKGAVDKPFDSVDEVLETVHTPSGLSWPLCPATPGTPGTPGTPVSDATKENQNKGEGEALAT